MSRRGLLAGSVLAAWALGIGVLFAREMNPSVEAKLAEAALRIVPVTTYFTVERDGRHIGFASVAIDTVPQALQVTEYVVTDSQPAPERRRKHDDAACGRSPLCRHHRHDDHHAAR